MAQIAFTPNLRRHVDCPPDTIEAETVAELLAAYFQRRPDVRGYVLDDQGAVRRHVKILVDGRNIRDREQQSDPVSTGAQVHIFQALSGG